MARIDVPFLDVRAAYDELKDDIDEAIARVLSSGIYVLGEEVSQFESEFASYCDARHCVGVANGLDALTLGLLALGVCPGDEVIVPSNTFIATWLAVSQCGAIPVPVEPDPMTFIIGASAVEEAITSRTRAVVPVHLYGHPADMDGIVELARARGLVVLDDAAQAHGARYRGRRVGGLADATAWSFYPGKNLGALGDGGAVTTNADDVAARVALLRNYGSKEKYVHEARGVNSRLDPIQAAVLRVKLRHLDEWNARRAAVAARYIQSLATCGIELPAVRAEVEHAWHLFVLRSPDRDSVREDLARQGVHTLVHYPTPPHRQEAYTNGHSFSRSLPIAEELSRTALSIPMGPHIAAASVDWVVEAVRSACGAT